MPEFLRSKIQVIRPLGKGSCGAVNLVCFNNGSKKVLMAEKSSSDPEAIEDLRREKRILDVFHGYPEIIQCLGDKCWYSDPEFDSDSDSDSDSSSDSDSGSGSDSGSDEDDDRDHDLKLNYGIYLEYVPLGNLFDVIKGSAQGKLPELSVRRYTKSILEGLAIVHEKGYVHCDVKPQNILVLGSDKVKIADFDLAKRRGEMSQQLRGTVLYIAPEGVALKEYEPPADVWSLGCTVVEMQTGRPARKFPEGMKLQDKLLLICGGNALPEIPEEVSPEAKDFLRRCLMGNPKKRWTPKMLLDHPFVSDRGNSDVHHCAGQLRKKRRVIPGSNSSHGLSRMALGH